MARRLFLMSVSHDGEWARMETSYAAMDIYSIEELEEGREDLDSLIRELRALRDTDEEGNPTTQPAPAAGEGEA